MPVKCPNCGKETYFEGNPFRPFCSQRCRFLDLGAWMSGTYRLAAEKQKDEGGDDPGNSPEGEGFEND